MAYYTPPSKFSKRNVKYHFQISTQPRMARTSGRDKRPIYPSPVLILQIVDDETGVDVTQKALSSYFAKASLYDEDEEAEMNDDTQECFLKPDKISNKLIGTLIVAGEFVSINGKKHLCFNFKNICLKEKGEYRLRFDLFEFNIMSSSFGTQRYIKPIKSLVSDSFLTHTSRVYYSETQKIEKQKVSQNIIMINDLKNLCTTNQRDNRDNNEIENNRDTSTNSNNLTNNKGEPIPRNILIRKSRHSVKAKSVSKDVPQAKTANCTKLRPHSVGEIERSLIKCEFSFNGANQNFTMGNDHCKNAGDQSYLIPPQANHRKRSSVSMSDNEDTESMDGDYQHKAKSPRSCSPRMLYSKSETNMRNMDVNNDYDNGDILVESLKLELNSFLADDEYINSFDNHEPQLDNLNDLSLKTAISEMFGQTYTMNEAKQLVSPLEEVPFFSNEEFANDPLTRFTSNDSYNSSLQPEALMVDNNMIDTNNQMGVGSVVPSYYEDNLADCSSMKFDELYMLFPDMALSPQDSIS